jgi:hypothetical protein
VKKVMVVLFLIVGLLTVANPAMSDTLSFKEGVSPSEGYKADAVHIEKCIYQGCTASSRNLDDHAVSNVGGIGRTVGFRTLLEFNLTHIKELVGWEHPVRIDSVKLVLTHKSGQSTGVSSDITVEVHRLGTNWDNTFDFEDTRVTWNNAPYQPGGSVGSKLSSLTFNPLVESEQKRTWDSSLAFIRAANRALGTPHRTLRLILIAPAAENVEVGKSSLASFVPEDSPFKEFRPELIVTYHQGLPLFEVVSPWAHVCLKAPSICSESIMKTNTFHDLDCAVEELLCIRLIQATDILQEPGAPPTEEFFKTPRNASITKQ